MICDSGRQLLRLKLAHRTQHTQFAFAPAEYVKNNRAKEDVHDNLYSPDRARDGIHDNLLPNMTCIRDTHDNQFENRFQILTSWMSEISFLFSVCLVLLRV